MAVQMFKTLLKRFRDQYIVNQVEQAVIPDFPPDRVCRYRVTFSGRVQNVGFRFEAYQLAQQLGITGYCENLTDGNVLAEFQGPENKIRFLISFMESIRRIVIENKIMEELPVLEGETGFAYR